MEWNGFGAELNEMKNAFRIGIFNDVKDFEKKKVISLFNWQLVIEFPLLKSSKKFFDANQYHL